MTQKDIESLKKLAYCPGGNCLACSTWGFCNSDKLAKRYALARVIIDNIPEEQLLEIKIPK